MTILREKQVWKRKSRPGRYERMGHLTPEQQANVLAALRVLRVRLGTWAVVAKAMQTSGKALEAVLYGRRRLNAGHAVRAAQLAGVTADDVLSGAWPKPGACPMCGRAG